MKRPIDFLNFLRVNQTVSKDKLQQGELASLTNAVLNNPKGVITIRGGFDNINNNSASSNAVKMVDSEDPAGQSYLLAGIEAGASSLLQKSSGGAWSNVMTSLSKGYFNHAQLKEGIIYTNGIDKPKFISGSAWATVEDLEITRPNVSSTTLGITQSDGGSMDVGVFMYVIVYATDDGNISPPSNAIFGIITSSSNTPLVTSGLRLALLLNDLPVSTDSRVTKKLIYRTEGGTAVSTGKGRVFYKLAEISNSETQFEDELPDSDLDFGSPLTFVATPETAEYIIAHADRIFFGNISLRDKFHFPMLEPSSSQSTTVGNGSGRNYASTLQDFNPNLTAGVTYGNATGLTGGLYYQYGCTFYDKDGKESDMIYSDVFLCPSAGADDVNLNVNGISPDWFFGDVGFSHPLIAGRKLYRTIGSVSSFLSGSRNMYLVLDEDTNPATFYRLSAQLNDNLDDATLATRPLYASPSLKEYPSGIAFSRAGRQFTFYLEDVRMINEDDRDLITGLADETDGVLIFKNDNIYKIYTGSASPNWYLRRHYSGIGCNDPKSILGKSNVTFFRHNKKVYMLPYNSVPQDIGETFQSSLNTLSSTLSIDATNEWLIIIANANTSEAMYIFDYITGSWYHFTTAGDLQAVCVKKYAMTNYVVGDFYTLISNKTYEYDKNLTYDDITGSNVYISGSVELPNIQADAFTFSKIRHLIAHVSRQENDGNITYTFASQDDAGVQTQITDSWVLGELDHRRFNSSTAVASRFAFTISGYFDTINSLRVFVRPVKRGFFKQ